MNAEIQYQGKTILISHNENETKCSFVHQYNTIELEVIGASNNKKAREIAVYVSRTVKNIEGRILESSRKDYFIRNPEEYLSFYNIPTIEGKGLGFTEYFHALNGATFRCPELQARFFNVDGTIKTQEELD